PDETDHLARRQDSPAPAPRHTRVVADGGEFVRPGNLEELFELLEQTPDAVLVAGATDAGVERNIRHARPPLVVAVDRLAPLRHLEITDDRIELGAALTLSEIEQALDGRVPLL